MIGLQLGLSFLILLFSVLAAVFSFLIWRSNTSQNIREQEATIRDSFEGANYEINMPGGSDVVNYTILVERVTCSEGSHALRDRLRKSIWGSNGKTTVRLGFRKGLRKHDGISRPTDPPEFFEEVRSHPWYDRLDIVVYPPDSGGVIVNIDSSKPKIVESKLVKLMQLVELILVSKDSDSQVVYKKEDMN